MTRGGRGEMKKGEGGDLYVYKKKDGVGAER